MQRFEIVNGVTEVEGGADEPAAKGTRNRHLILLLFQFSDMVIRL